MGCQLIKRLVRSLCMSNYPWARLNPLKSFFSTPVVFYLTLSTHIFYAFAVFVDLLLQVWPLVMVSSFNTAYWMNKFN